MQPYGSHAPSHVTSLPYQPSQLSQGHGPPQAPLQPPTNSHQGFANQQQVLPQIPYQQISYQQGVPGAPPEYPSQSAPQDYSSQYFTQASMASYPNFPAQPQMVYSQQPLLWWALICSVCLYLISSINLLPQNHRRHVVFVFFFCPDEEKETNVTQLSRSTNYDLDEIFSDKSFCWKIPLQFLL